uniref:RNA-directed DNA polymerase, eukaryota, reverse transcriptase zinc-binding domain protein n=1 Tax=Tanacetum cinerariifolium TaxID=118510 RepID=A0A6L2K5M2_TANCI|nr:RNA-directed DNA polymerase, eukaryota, reverse transcriptase zinc-binding domain protein [Tanacetum cinerariifolium]
MPLPFIPKDEGCRLQNCPGNKSGSIYGFLSSTDRVLEGILLILLMYTYALILGAECLKKGSETLPIHFRKQDITSSVFGVFMALPRVVMVVGTTTNLASGTFELHSIGWVVSPFSTVRSEILFYSSLDSYDKNTKVNDNGEYSLIGSFYKIIAKILANWLVSVIKGLINEVQSAFIAERQILDGPFILKEVIQWCKLKKNQILIFKVDFEKAYDSVRWDFLDEVLRKFGFGDKWCLFKAISIGDGSVNLSHLFYADDAVFVGQWNDSNITTLVHVLECFHKLSGLRINMCKSKLMRLHVDGELVHRAARQLGCLVLNLPSSYLGSIVGDNMARQQAWEE